jgi:flagellar motor protein MotB
VGRSQGASIFWGLISVCFATAACYYYWKNHENEGSAMQMRDTVLQLRDENETLKSQKEHLQASKAEEESQLKTREDLVQEKETELAAEETRLEGLGRQSQVQTQQNQAQVAVVKKFNDAISKLDKGLNTDVVNRAGRPALRIPNADLFAPGDATLKPEGKALLTQLAQSLIGQLDAFELRVVAYTDTDAEGAPGSAQKAASPSPSWDLTAARASSLARFYRDQTPLPFRNVIVMARGDSDPVVGNGEGDHTRNRRVEITVNPLPVPFHAPDPDTTTSANATASTDSQDSTANTPTPAKKEKPKDKNSSR